MRTFVRIFCDGGHHCSVGAVHQAVEQSKHHKQHGGDGRFHRQAKVIRQKLRRRHQRDRDGGVQNKRSEFAPLTNITP